MTTNRDTEDEESSSQFIEYFEAHLARKGWGVKRAAAVAGLSPSIIFRWRHGYVPSIEHARAFARAVGVPTLEVLIESGQLTPEEAGAYSSGKPLQIADIDTLALARELTRRVEHASQRVNGGALPADEHRSQSAAQTPDDLALSVAIAAYAPDQDTNAQERTSSNVALTDQ